jgi:hypothetical protein
MTTAIAGLISGYSVVANHFVDGGRYGVESYRLFQDADNVAFLHLFRVHILFVSGHQNNRQFRPG